MVTFEDARPDLKRYYKSELNEGKLMSDFKKYSHKTIVLCCDICNTPKKYKPYFLIKSYKFHCNRCNSLAVVYPELAKEFNEEKNEKSAYDVPKCGGEDLWWQCFRGHEWKTSPAHRVHMKAGCPVCNESKGEKIIRKWLVENNINFMTQYHVYMKNRNAYYDFYIPKFKLFVEVHGAQHFGNHSFFKIYSYEKQQLIDAQKQAYAEANGRYIMVDYREHDPELALERFIEQFDKMF